MKKYVEIFEDIVFAATITLGPIAILGVCGWLSILILMRRC